MPNYHLQKLPDLQQDSEETVFPKLDTYSQFGNKSHLINVKCQSRVIISLDIIRYRKAAACFHKVILG